MAERMLAVRNGERVGRMGFGEVRMRDRVLILLWERVRRSRSGWR